MDYTLYSAVQTEVITLSEAKNFIKLDSTSFSSNLTITAIVTGGYHDITASATTTGINTAGKKTLFSLQPVAVSAGGTLDVTIQESLDNTTFTDWSGSAFTQITTSNATTYQELEYTGYYPYTRAKYTIVSAQASFTINVIISDPDTIEDDLVEEFITSAREYAEQYTNRAIGTQKWKLVMDEFPDNDYIRIQFPPLQSVESVVYIDYEGTTATMSASQSEGYIVDTSKEPGGLFLAYANAWPTTTLLPYNGVIINFTCGYTSTTVPKKIKNSILKMVGLLYRYRDSGIPKEELNSINHLLAGQRVINIG
jgi:uncharacterized phiE125 gp8 family phage protein